MMGTPLLTYENIKSTVGPVLSLINERWSELTGNARDANRESIETIKRMAAESMDGHLGDYDHDHPHILYLPNDYVYPGGRFVVQFYWDSYFIIKSLLLSDRINLAKGMIENCLYLIQEYGMVIANRRRWTAGSQLPFLAQMVSDVYEKTLDQAWLIRCLPLIEKELLGYWMNSDHLCYRGLSRYHAPPYFPREAIASITLDNETTWDMSPRFDENDVLCLLPVDLNSNLYIYERNLAIFYAQLGKKKQAAYWQSQADTRRNAINSILWNDRDCSYYDFNYCTGKHKKIRSLATFFPLFAEISSEEQAPCVKNELRAFETQYGLVTCDQDYGYSDRQWNYPIGWAPLHWIVYRGLENYGYATDAKRIALKWLNLNYRIWLETGTFFEKYDVIHGTHKVLYDRYPNQEGFGWTNAIFHLLVERLLDSSP